MSWSYSGDPSTSDLDKLRFYIGDTDESFSCFTDEELNFLLKSEKSFNNIVNDAFERMLAILSKEVDYKIGSEQVSAKQRYDNTMRLYKEFDKNVARIRNKPQLIGHDPCSPDIFELGGFDNASYCEKKMYKRYNSL